MVCLSFPDSKISSVIIYFRTTIPVLSAYSYFNYQTYDNQIYIEREISSYNCDSSEKLDFTCGVTKQI